MAMFRSHACAQPCLWRTHETRELRSSVEALSMIKRRVSELYPGRQVNWQYMLHHQAFLFGVHQRLWLPASMHSAPQESSSDGAPFPREIPRVSHGRGDPVGGSAECDDSLARWPRSYFWTLYLILHEIGWIRRIVDDVSIEMYFFQKIQVTWNPCLANSKSLNKRMEAKSVLRAWILYKSRNYFIIWPLFLRIQS